MKLNILRMVIRSLKKNFLESFWRRKITVQELIDYEGGGLKMECARCGNISKYVPIMSYDGLMFCEPCYPQAKRENRENKEK